MEEDIKVLENIIKYTKEAAECSLTSGSEKEQWNREVQAIENLIARNKELEEMNEKYKIHLTDEQYLKIIDSVETDANKEWKSKVREKIKEYRYLDEENIKNKDNMEFEECFIKTVLYTRIIWLLQELLEERN